jgi:hypothetical protein
MRPEFAPRPPAGDARRAVLGPLRTLISVAFLALLLWAAFAIKLGGFTFAEHMDRIGQTREARALLDGARARVRPGLEEIKQRVLGEYVEAPTHIPAGAPPARPRPPGAALTAEPRNPRPATDAPAPAARVAASASAGARAPVSRVAASARAADVAVVGTAAPARTPSVAAAGSARASTAETVKLPGRAR